MFVKIDPENPEPWLVTKVVALLRRGGVVVLPTDTIYALACSVEKPEAIARLYALKGIDPRKPLSILLARKDDIGRWTRALTTPAYRMIKRVLPGAYTFLLPASAEVPRVMLRERKTIGVRVPDDAIVRAVVTELGTPLISTSIRGEDHAFVNEPLVLEEMFGTRVDGVVDGGPRDAEPSTIVDLTGDEPELVRAGKGDVRALQLD